MASNTRNTTYEIQDSKKPNVLVADDEEVIRDLFEKLLGKQGYAVSTAVDGIDTLDKIKKGNYDMLILDLKMSRMGGMDVLHNIRGLKKDLITIVITGYATIDTAKEAIKLGCFDYITKPFDIENVNIVIKRAFEMRRLAEEKKRFQEQIQRAEKLTAVAEKKRAEELASLNEELHAVTKELRQSNDELIKLKVELEQKVDKRTAELRRTRQELEKKVVDLEKFHKFVVGRELKMVELKNRIKKLEEQLKEEGSRLNR